MSALVPVEEGL